MEVVMQHINTADQIALDLVKERVKRMKKFYNHLFIFMIGLILYVSKRYLGAPLNFFPIKHLNETVMWCWTFIVAAQGVKLFIIENVFGNKWEKNQILKIMNNDNAEKQIGK